MIYLKNCSLGVKQQSLTHSYVSIFRAYEHTYDLLVCHLLTLAHLRYKIVLVKALIYTFTCTKKCVSKRLPL